jgi:PEP-CTERM motif-containing protein
VQVGVAKGGRRNSERTMKTLFLTAALGVVCVSAFAQGTFTFDNIGAGWQAQVFHSDGVTPLVGTSWLADFYWAAGVVGDSTLLSALGQPTTFSTTQPGFFFGGQRTIPGVATGTITGQVRVWDSAAGPSWQFALGVVGALVGESILFQVNLPNGDMSGLNGHPWHVFLANPVPEPSTLALAALGSTALLVLRRRPRSVLNHPAATNPAITHRSHAEDQCRRFVGRDRYARHGMLVR